MSSTTTKRKIKNDNAKNTIEAKKKKKQQNETENKKIKDIENGDGLPDESTIKYEIKTETDDGRKYNFKTISWNVAGLRAWFKKGVHTWLLEEDADIICFQETKCSSEQVPSELRKLFDSYNQYWHIGEKPGYSGVGLLSKIKPLNITFGIGKKDHDNEGRTITAEYKDYYLVTSYVPNSQRKLIRLEYRQTWDNDFREYLKSLDEKKPVILCGDLNVSHLEIDLKNPKTNKKTAGFTIEERDGFSCLLKENFVDTFRKLYPKREGAYTFWSNMGNARAKNVGWRLDYFVISDRLNKDLCDNVIHSQVKGSDHCPISLLMAM